MSRSPTSSNAPPGDLTLRFHHCSGSVTSLDQGPRIGVLPSTLGLVLADPLAAQADPDQGCKQAGDPTVSSRYRGGDPGTGLVPVVSLEVEQRPGLEGVEPVGEAPPVLVGRVTG